MSQSEYPVGQVFAAPVGATGPGWESIGYLNSGIATPESPLTRAQASIGRAVDTVTRLGLMESGAAPEGMTPIRTGTHRGVDWAICPSMLGPLNGYFRVPASIDAEALDAPGGITYNDDGWAGFDTLHFRDAWDPRELRALGVSVEYTLRSGLSEDAPTWTLERLIQATIVLAGQVADLAGATSLNKSLTVRWEVNPEARLLDEIDALVDERMAGGEPIGGYDYNDPGFPDCPHCGGSWHGLAITQRMEEMRWQGAFDEAYRYRDDTSRVLCPGSEFIGPVASARQLDELRAHSEYERRLTGLLSDDPSHEVLREAVRLGRFMGPMEYIGCYFAGLPLPDMARCEGPWGVFKLSSPERPAVDRYPGFAQSHVYGASSGLYTRALVTLREQMYAVTRSPIWQLPDDPLTVRRWLSGDPAPTLVEPRWWRCDDTSELGMTLNIQDGQTYLHTDAAEPVRVVPVAGRLQYNLGRNWIEIHCVTPPSVGVWRELEPPCSGASATYAVFDEATAFAEAQTPQQRALPRPSTSPPMWVEDPTRSRRRRR